MKKTINKGFTLIELLVVLAIIGILIALAVIGLQGAQANQRNTARKDISAQINSQLQTYLSNGNSIPATGALVSSGFMSTTACSTAGGNSGQTNGYTVGSTCEGFDGLTIGTINDCAAASYTTSTTGLNLCYTGGAGSAGYKLGVILEGQTTPYYVAQ